MTAFPAIFFAPTHPNQQSACEICGLVEATELSEEVSKMLYAMIDKLKATKATQ
jgi:hypothetical protein